MPAAAREEWNTITRSGESPSADNSFCIYATILTRIPHHPANRIPTPTMATPEIHSSVRKIFKDYLEKNHHRKTEERFNILDEIYHLENHFDVDSLYLGMKKKGHRVSRATIYNTIELLIDCELVTRHQFGKNISRFERSYTYRQHDHLICEDCEQVFEFCDPRIHQIQSTMGDILKFNVTHHSLNLFGKCRELLDTGNCKNYKKS
jgi:Fur family ferric uptake transcriptional regulator